MADDPPRTPRQHDESAYPGLDIFQIKPVILGGHPTDPQNRIALTREQHIAAVRYWNRIIRDLPQSNFVAGRD